MYRKRTDNHLDNKGGKVMTDAICIDVSFAYCAIFRKIISILYNESNRLGFYDKTMKLNWKTQKAYDKQVANHCVCFEK